MINSQLGEYAKYSWDFYQIPSQIHTDTSNLQDIGEIDFEDYTITNGLDKFFSHKNSAGINSEDLIASLEKLKLEKFPRHEMLEALDSTGYPVNLDMFLTLTINHAVLSILF